MSIDLANAALPLSTVISRSPRPLAVVDTHAHTGAYSNDARQTGGELLADAETLGLAGICITEHYDKNITYRDNIEEVFDIAAYFRHMKPLQDFAGRQGPRLYLGVELGWLPELSGHLSSLAASWPFDSIVLSLHLLDGLDFFINPEVYQAGAAATYRRTLERTLDMIQDCPDFDILGHFDYVSRYAPGRPPLQYAHAPETFDAIFRWLASHGKALEINTRTADKMKQHGRSGDDCWPDPQILQRYRQLGGQYVSLGADSHQNGQAGLHFAEACAFLRRQGVTHLTHFVQRQPVLTPMP